MCKRTQCLVLNADQVVSQLFNDLGCFASLDAGWIVTNENSLLGSHTNHAFGVMSTVNTSIIGSQQHELLSLDVQTVALQPGWVVKTLSNLLYLISLQCQAARRSPDRVTSSRVYHSPVDFTSSQKIISVSYRRQKDELVTTPRGSLATQCFPQTNNIPCQDILTVQKLSKGSGLAVSPVNQLVMAL